MTDPLVFDRALDLMIVADLVLKLPLLLFDSAKIYPWLRRKLIRRLAKLGGVGKITAVRDIISSIQTVKISFRMGERASLVDGCFLGGRVFVEVEGGNALE